MISVTHFASGAADFVDRAQIALQALSRRPGYLRGTLARSADAGDAWVIVTEWENVGSYRRALGSFEVKVQATPLLGESIDMPTAFESLVEVAPGGAALARESDRA